MKKIIIANWKMNLSPNDSVRLAKNLKNRLNVFNKMDLVVCPDFISLDKVSETVKNTNIKLGAQDVFWEKYGAYTGEISASALSDMGCEYAIVGHSERRKFLREDDEMIHKKLKILLAQDNITPILCIGETDNDNSSSYRNRILNTQLEKALQALRIMGDRKFIVAYEPVWAIGSGQAMDAEEVDYTHKIIRLGLENIFGKKIANSNFRIIYGGSVNENNIQSFKQMKNIDGFLVGGASLNADKFYNIIKIINN